MSISFGMILFGALLIVAGWQDKSLAALARGDNSTPKGQVMAGAAGAPAATPTSAAAGGMGGRTVGAGSAAPGNAPSSGGGGGGFG